MIGARTGVPTLMGMPDLHFIYDLPPVRKHAGTRVILSEYVDGLLCNVNQNLMRVNEFAHRV